jgi:hypothetical protein
MIFKSTYRNKLVRTMIMVLTCIPMSVSCGLFLNDAQAVVGKIDNSDSVCKTFQFEVMLSVAGLSSSDAKRSGSVEAGKIAVIDYGNNISDGTNFKVSGTCTFGTQQIPLSLDVKQTERFTGWTVKVVDPNSPKLTFPCSLCK